jgi:hypothetical protein
MGNYVEGTHPYGGGIYCNRSSLRINNCIVWNNASQQIYGCDSSSIVAYSNVEKGFSGPGNIIANPQFVSKLDYHLLPNSPCIDAGDPAYSASPGETDIDNDPRIIGSHTDMGADEFVPGVPLIEVSSTEFVFQMNQLGPNPDAQVLSIRNAGAGVLNWEIVENCPWIQIDPNSGSSTGEYNSVTLSVDTAGLSWGEYSCTLIVSAQKAGNSPKVIYVRLIIVGPAIELSTNTFEFFAYLGGENPSDQILTINNSGGGVLRWSVHCDCDWLAIDPCQGISEAEPCEVTLKVNIAGLSWGQYNCELRILDPNSQNSPQTVQVNLVIRGPIIEVSTKSFLFCTYEDSTVPPDQTLVLRNSGGGTLRWQIAEECTWLQVKPQAGSLSRAQTDEITLSVDIADLDEGAYTCDLIIYDPNAENTPQKATATLTLFPKVAEILPVPLQYPTIQAAIDSALPSEMIVVAAGVYTGPGNQDIDFKGKAITVRSIDPHDPCVVAETVIDIHSTFDEPHYGFLFHSGEDANSVLAGFTITNFLERLPGFPPEGGVATGISCRDSSPTIINCTIASIRSYYENWEPKACSAVNILNGNPTIIGCTLSNNYCEGYSCVGGAVFNRGGNPTLINCTLSNNYARHGGGMYNDGGYVTLINCIFRQNKAYGPGGLDNNLSGIVTLTNCIFDGNWSTMDSAAIGNYGEVVATNCTFLNNFGEPYEHGAAITGTGNATMANCIFSIFMPAPYQDSYKALVPIRTGKGTISVTYSNVLAGWPGEGNIDVDPCFPVPEYGDYHLKSQAGRWYSKTKSWVKDDVTSPCIDAGDPNTPIGLEPFPNGGRVNMGAYGGTAEASKSYFGKPVCETIVAGDINGDCIIDFKDFTLMALHWLECIEPNQGVWRLAEDDTEDSYFCEGNFDIFYPCSNAADEDWDTYALPADPGATSYIYENYVIPSGISMADFRIKYQQTASVTPGLCTTVTDYWDGNAWTALNCTALSNQISTLTVRLPDDALNRTTLQLRTRAWKGSGLIGSGSGMYYEGKVIWYFWPVCETIVAGDINGDCKVDWADFTLMARHWLEESR